MKKVLSILLLACSLNVAANAMAPVPGDPASGDGDAVPVVSETSAAQDSPAVTAPDSPAAPETSADKTAKVVAATGFFNETWAFTQNHKAVVITGAVATVLVALAACNKKAVSQKTAEALAWVKRNPALATSIIAGVLIVGSAGYVYINAETGKGIVDNIKGAGSKVLDGISLVPTMVKDAVNDGLKIATDHPYWASTSAIGVIAVIAAAYDLTRDDSVIKKASDAIYNKISSKKVEIIA